MNIGRIFPALILVITGCTMSAVAPDNITLMAARTDRTVKLTLTNESSGPIGYNLCTSALQRRIGDTWTGVETGDICTMEIRTLQKGDIATFDKTLPNDTASGEYRYAVNVEWNGSPTVVASDPFTVP